jgi:hypothetical protein
MKILGDDFMNKCPLCEIDYPHSHFSYDIAEYVDACKSVLADAETQRDMYDAEVDRLQAMLDVATKGIIDAMTYITCPPGVWNILNTALAEINRIGGVNE